MKYIGLFSGGKDSLTACHLMQDQLDGVLYARTGIGLPENEAYVHDLCQSLGWKLYIVEPAKHETYEIFIKRFGFPHKGIHNEIMGYLKWHPWRRFCNKYKPDRLISGRRPTESARRKRIAKQKVEQVEKNMTFDSVIFEWSTKDVWDYIKKQELPLCPVYQTMEMGGDCFCGAFSHLGESELLWTFHPELATKIRDLELKYGGRWGNQSAMKGAEKQSKILDYGCSECIFR